MRRNARWRSNFPASAACLMLGFMNGNAREKAERLRRALRDNLKRRKAVVDDNAGEMAARRADRLEPRLVRSNAKDEQSGGSGGE